MKQSENVLMMVRLLSVIQLLTGEKNGTWMLFLSRICLLMIWVCVILGLIRIFITPG